jgi:hypothetical protein
VIVIYTEQQILMLALVQEGGCDAFRELLLLLQPSKSIHHAFGEK